MTAWKNLHFRPPILKKLDDDRVSDKILIRTLPSKDVILGHIALRSYDDSFYHLVSRGYEEILMVDPYYEWMEVPE